MAVVEDRAKVLAVQEQGEEEDEDLVLRGIVILVVHDIHVVMVLFIAYVVYSQKAVAQVQMTSNPGQINV